MRFMNMSSETKYVILSTIEIISIKFPNIVKDYYKSFFIISLEKNYCKLKKIDILFNLIDELNFN